MPEAGKKTPTDGQMATAAQEHEGAPLAVRAGWVLLLARW
jgi:hypothetical protein